MAYSNGVFRTSLTTPGRTIIHLPSPDGDHVEQITSSQASLSNIQTFFVTVQPTGGATEQGEIDNGPSDGIQPRLQESTIVHVSSPAAVITGDPLSHALNAGFDSDSDEEEYARTETATTAPPADERRPRTQRPRGDTVPTPRPNNDNVNLGVFPDFTHPYFKTLFLGLFVSAFCCLPLGVTAVVYSLKVRDRIYYGDRWGARRYSMIAYIIGWFGVLFGGCAFIGLLYYYAVNKTVLV
ncbi:uncharacterized protein LOC141912969 [Tubulanus polymorphus]|uniref:uncharacterized protein LOC141912969 n=1 Tax=Tubulanus polymorphus TaxID=672921 RepID=UPI003DA613C9